MTHAADSLAVNTKALSRIFKEEIGENFVDYLARLRMDEAKRLLTEAFPFFHNQLYEMQ